VGSISLTTDSYIRAFLHNAQSGITICLGVIVPATICGSIGVKSKKLSSLTSVISIS